MWKIVIAANLMNKIEHAGRSAPHEESSFLSQPCKARFKGHGREIKTFATTFDRKLVQIEYLSNFNSINFRFSLTFFVVSLGIDWDAGAVPVRTRGAPWQNLTCGAAQRSARGPVLSQ